MSQTGPRRARHRAAARTASSTLLAAAFLDRGAVVLLWYAPGLVHVYKALHVISTVVWVGGDITLTTLGIVFERRRDGRRWPSWASSAPGSASTSTRRRCSPCSASASP